MKSRFRTALLFRTIGFGLACCMLLLLSNCTSPLRPETGDHARNDTVFFPGVAYTHIYAAQLDNPDKASLQGIFLADGRLTQKVLHTVRRLSPAHKADVGVALATSYVTRTYGDCFWPEHAVIWKENENAVAALLLCFECNTYRFEPESALDLRDENMKRLRLVFEELEMVAENPCIVCR